MSVVTYQGKKKLVSLDLSKNAYLVTDPVLLKTVLAYEFSPGGSSPEAAYSIVQLLKTGAILGPVAKKAAVSVFVENYSSASKPICPVCLEKKSKNSGWGAGGFETCSDCSLKGLSDPVKHSSAGRFAVLPRRVVHPSHWFESGYSAVNH